ncbi:MAG: hypothetical protein EWV85_15140 [Microcystis aeruginosa Ma_QC_C_20070703_M131]|jgi:hypothetical protein|uniref:Uncharacterized protein n=1 Tax=Microcystis aeruginosa Ma_QC_C_20070703_M131 TaxID=2486263 RepID=A0A551XVN6_MICAE|nr:MAG: hypothetical protein EWV85_15140 [Microcystis aeruginosa Ma_QC_C_20070703_M131]
MSDNNIEIKVFGSRKEYASLDSQDEPRVAEVIRTRVLPQSEAEYFRVNVKVKRRRDRTPAYLVAYLLRKDIYLAEVVKVDVDSDFQVSDITYNYEDSDEDEDEEGEDYTEEENYLKEEWDEYAFDFVAATPVPEISTAKAAVEYLHDLATKAGLKSRMLLGAEATVANYKLYLTSGLKGFVNVGHGNPNGIALADGSLNADWFQKLSGNPLKPGVIYFNSCQVHNEPLKSAVMQAGARTFIGGIVNLLIGPSEEVCKCFWNKILTSTIQMGDALHQCEKDKYPNEGAHGISGDTGPFSIVNLKLARAMWVHGHSMQIEYPDRLDLEKRMGFYIQVRGKPFTSNWFHFAIPTPVIVDGTRLLVGSVMIRFRTGPGASVYAVHVYDGETKIAAHDGLNLSPQSGFSWPRFDVPTHPPIRWGLGISIGVRFGDGANLPANKLLVEISSVGCDFAVKV